MKSSAYPEKSREQAPESRRALMISYPFPPAASAGVLRTLRFVRYLPEFGWNPLVLTVMPEDGKHAADRSLEEYLPDDVAIERTNMWHPEDNLARLFRNVRGGRNPGRRGSENRSNPPGLVVCPNPGEQPRGKTGELTSGDQEASSPSSEQDRWWHPRMAMRNLQQLAFQTPDAKMWWSIPTLPRALRLVRRWNPDVIFATAPPHSSLLLATILGRWTRKPVVLDFRDPWSRSPWSESHMTVARRLAPWLEGACVRRADAVLLNTTRTTDEFRDHYGSALADRFFTLPNGYDPALLESLPEPLPRSGSGERDCLELVHPGAIYGQRDLRPLLEALERVAQSGTPLHFEQIGVLRQSYNLADYLAKHALASTVSVTGVLPHETTLSRMAAADVLVVIQPGTPLQVPGKLYEMMMFRKPILALTGEGETADLVRRYELGIVVDPHDGAAIARAIERLRRESSGESSARRAKALDDFNGRRLTGRLAEIFQRVSRKPGDRAANSADITEYQQDSHQPESAARRHSVAT